ncbi:hypothetical protein ABZS66_00020 [Dactylosporangium sp. NPDC005572]|uniref:hypothetical protein n=1 Tax=Dactylosporangium sp. NPDC005572 TaxID=3156889 RepID=UPI0033B8BB32
MAFEGTSDLRVSLATLVRQMLENLAQVDGIPAFGNQPDFERWTRVGQERFLALRQGAWQPPAFATQIRWIESFPAMVSVRSAIADHPVLRERVDRCVGVEFARHGRPLVPLIYEHMLVPIVTAQRGYAFDERIFDQHFVRLEHGLLDEKAHLVQFVPFNALLVTSDVESVDLGDGYVLQPLTDRQLSAAIGYHAVPAIFAGGTNSVEVGRAHQWGLTFASAYPIVSESPEAPRAADVELPTANAGRLASALRLVCGGSVVATRLLHLQHDDDFPLLPGLGAVLSDVPAADYARPTLLTAAAVTEVRLRYEQLGRPAVVSDRSLQMALRRFVQAGSQHLAVERITDLMTCAEIVLLVRNQIQVQGKGARIAAEAEALLSAAAPPGWMPGHVRDFMVATYRIRNAAMHGEDLHGRTFVRLDGSSCTALDAVADDATTIMGRCLSKVLDIVAQ